MKDLYIIYFIYLLYLMYMKIIWFNCCVWN